MDYNSTTALTTSPREIRGDFLARIRRSPRARAWLATELLDGEAILIEPTVGQVASLCRTSPTTIRRACNGHGSNPKPVDAVLIKAWARASHEEQAQFVRKVGAEALWTAIVATL